MNILFFQNCISPHQMPYINELHKIDNIQDIYVIAPEVNTENRKNMGWKSSIYSNNNVNFLINPSFNEVNNLFNKYNNTNTWGVFSGITSFPFVTKYFKMSLSFNIKRSIITEPPYLYNHPLWQHALRFAIKDWRFVKHINKVFLMGDEFIPYYKFWSRKWDVIPFMYCTEWKERKDTVKPNNENSKLKILFVGSLSYRKNVQLIFKALSLLNESEQQEIELGIIGDGEARKELEQMATLIPQINILFYGTKPMNTISDYMVQYDILCLPSLHDGWGAVINEAITLGLYAICSDHCGAKYIIKKSNLLCGSIFTNNNPNSLSEILKDCITKREQIRNETNKRIKWAFNNIKGNIVANYFIKHLEK